MNEPGTDGASLGVAEGGSIRARFTYTGYGRPAHAMSLEMIQQWQQLSTTDHRPNDCKEEFLFEQEGRRHWLIVDPACAESIRASGDGPSIDLVLRYVGAWNGLDGRRWVFVASL